MRERKAIHRAARALTDFILRELRAAWTAPAGIVVTARHSPQLLTQ
jgi:hypothetical protein